MSIPDKQDIEQAHQRIRSYIHRTPVFTCENFQKIGAFKARGAMNAILSLSANELARGVATHSSGNHAQAVARAAKILKVKSYIVMPENAPEIKRRGVLAYGGEISDCEATLASRESTLASVIEKTGASEIHPFNNYAVIAGQGTAAKELFEEVPDLDIVVAPVGGGGLLSGTALATNFFSPHTVIIAAEPAGADDAYRSMKSGKLETSQANSIADGLLTSLGSKTFPIIQKYVKEVITVTDGEIVSAMRMIWERMKIIVEPSCAVPLAAVLKSGEKFAGKKVGIILSGGNVDLEKALKLFSS
jgi:threonine dehydratase